MPSFALFLPLLAQPITCIPLPPATTYASQTVLITGASLSSIGLAAAVHILRANPTRLIITARNPAKGTAALDHLRSLFPGTKTILEVWPLDMASFASVIAFSARVKKEASELDVVFLNAGIAKSTLEVYNRMRSLSASNRQTGVVCRT